MEINPSSGFPYYIKRAGNGNLLNQFSSEENFNLFSSVSEEQSAFRYAADKWSIKQIVGHITDHERIMTYRALRFSRKDETILPGYDQNLFVANGGFDEIKFDDLLKELFHVRQSTILMLKSLSDEKLQLKGTAWKFELSVEDFFKATIGHEYHHIDVLKDRYLPCIK
jgi:hypothetical protein